MPVLNSVMHMHEDLVRWRRHLHAHPELGFDVQGTAGFVMEQLQKAGCDRIVGGIGGTGIVGLIEGRLGSGPTIAFRADMDALPIEEESRVLHASTRRGHMHACGHDGHTTMLLGAAVQLADTRNFAGTVALIFQPAEEIGQGARAMLDDGLMERFGISHVYGMHNMPGIAAGTFAIRPGAIMAATAKFTITVSGRGAHAAQPHASVDPVVVAAQIVAALQTIVSRRVDPLNSLVVTVTKVDAGTAFNVIPETVELWGTTRALDVEMAAEAEGHIRSICEGIARSAGASAHVDYLQAHPPVLNRPDEAELAAQVAREIVGAHAVDAATRPVLAGEDFSHMLVARPGAFIFIGNGDSAALHHPAYDFDDATLPAGVSYWVRLAETRLAPAAVS